MKEITAIIRMNMINQTRQALTDIGVSSFTVRKVLGRGKGNVDFRILAGATQGNEEAIGQLGSGPVLIPKRQLSIVIEKSKVPEIVQTLIKVNQTGKSGDGKIFVSNVEDSVRVRTGERGVAALNDSQ